MVKGISMLRKTRGEKNVNSLVSIGEKTIIGEEVSFEGRIRSTEDLIINGSVKGSVKLDNSLLTVAPKGQVKAEIHAQNVSISGQLIGNIKVISNVEITKEADFSGQIKSKRVSIEDGAFLKAVIELEHETQKKTLSTDTISDQEANGSEKETLTLLKMFRQLDRGRHKDLPISNFWQHLDYPPQSFDGILLWDLIDHLEDREVCRLVELCIKMLRPGGLLMIFSLGEQATQIVVNSFVIGEDFGLDLRPQPHLDLPFHMRHNREVLSLLTPFTLVKSFIYHNRLRQFLFQRD